MGLYQTAQKIVELLRAGAADYEELLRLLMDEGMSRDEAIRLLDRLVKQVEEE